MRTGVAQARSDTPPVIRTVATASLPCPPRSSPLFLSVAPFYRFPKIVSAENFKEGYVKVDVVWFLPRQSICVRANISVRVRANTSVCVYVQTKRVWMWISQRPKLLISGKTNLNIPIQYTTSCVPRTRQEETNAVLSVCDSHEWARF